MKKELVKIFIYSLGGNAFISTSNKICGKILYVGGGIQVTTESGKSFILIDDDYKVNLGINDLPIDYFADNCSFTFVG